MHLPEGLIVPFHSPHALPRVSRPSYDVTRGEVVLSCASFIKHCAMKVYCGMEV
jgi:hypothetical protein